MLTSSDTDLEIVSVNEGIADTCNCRLKNKMRLKGALIWYIYALFFCLQIPL